MQDMLTEPVSTPEEFVSGLSHIEIMGDGNARFCLFVNRVVNGCGIIRLPKRDIIMPLTSLPDAITKCMSVSAVELAGRMSRYLPLSQH